MTVPPSDWVPENVDLKRPNAARVYDYYLGGAHNFEVDRAFAKQIINLVPEVGAAARLNRRFLHRAVRFLASQGVSQFLDIGSGIPTVGHVHEIAKAINPASRVVYVDSEPVAVAHSELLLHDVPNADVLAADLRDPDRILGSEQVRRLIDFTQPVAVLMVSVLHFVPDGEELTTALRRYIETLAPGSAVVISHATPEEDPERLGRAAQLYQSSSTPFITRSHEQIGAFLVGLDLVEPGLVWTPLWLPDSDDNVEHPEQARFYAAVARKP
ncbi:MAG TPA: SAM-dependent methyltransferase [Pseudonocardiaceae bacterium]|nr:SAM-dependent methyltransferase [Pseudonocardiaceae bacterium]